MPTVEKYPQVFLNGVLLRKTTSVAFKKENDYRLLYLVDGRPVPVFDFNIHPQGSRPDSITVITEDSRYDYSIFEYVNALNEYLYAKGQ